MQACILMLGKPPEHLQTVTHALDFLLAPSPAKCSFNGWAIHAKLFMNHLYMAYKAKKGLNFHVGPWWCTFNAIAFKFASLGPTPCLDI